MIIIHMPKDESKEIFERLNKYDDPEEREHYLQGVYKGKFFQYLRRLEKQNGMEKLQIEGTVKEGKVRLNGTREKKIAIDQDYTITLKLHRIRCDALKTCQVIMLSLFMPYSRLLLCDVADIIINAQRKNNNFAKSQIARVMTGWIEWTKTRPAQVMSTLDQFLDEVDYALTQMRCQILQVRNLKMTCIV